jgi:hypothetical protein
MGLRTLSACVYRMGINFWNWAIQTFWYDSLGGGGSAHRKASTYTGQHKAEERGYPCEWESNPRSQCSSGTRPQENNQTYERTEPTGKWKNCVTREVLFYTISTSHDDATIKDKKFKLSTRGQNRTPPKITALQHGAGQELVPYEPHCRHARPDCPLLFHNVIRHVSIH